MKLFKFVFLGIVLILSNFLSGASLAADWIKFGEERFKLGGGVFLPSFDTRLRVDNNTIGDGTGVDLENDLGFSSDETTFWVGGYWRFAAKHRIGAAYFQFDRDASTTAKTDITIGDEIYPAGASLDSNFKFQVIPINYAYSFLKREKFELAGTIGLNWTKVDFDVSGSGSFESRNPEREPAGLIMVKPGYPIFRFSGLIRTPLSDPT